MVANQRAADPLVPTVQPLAWASHPALHAAEVHLPRGAAMNPWHTVADAALLVARPQHTIRTWIRRGKIPALCRLADRQLLVHLPELGDYARSAEQRWHDRRHAHRRRNRVA